MSYNKERSAISGILNNIASFMAIYTLTCLMQYGNLQCRKYVMCNNLKTISYAIYMLVLSPAYYNECNKEHKNKQMKTFLKTVDFI